MTQELKFFMPGIVLEEPDIFENNPTLKTNISEPYPEESNDNLKFINIEPEIAFDKFKNEYLRVDNANNFDTQLKIPKGYENLEYNPEAETLGEKYERISKDILNLQNQIKDNNKDEDTNLDPQKLIKNLDDINEFVIKQKYSTILNNSNFPIETISNFEEVIKIISSVFSNSRKNIENLKEELQNTLKGDKINLEIFADAKDINKDQSSQNLYDIEIQLKINDLNRRIRQVQKFIGYADGTSKELINEKYNDKNTTIMDKITDVQNKLNVLDKLLTTDKGMRLEIETFCKDLFIRYKELFPNPPNPVQPNLTLPITSQNASTLLSLKDFSTYTKTLCPENSEENSMVLSPEDRCKINKLYEMLSRVESICDELPELTNKLKLYQHIQQKGESFVLNYDDVIETQDLIRKSLSDNHDLMQNLRSEFTQNVELMQNNFKNLEERITDLLSLAKTQKL